MLLLLACTPAAGSKGGATRFPGKTTSWWHADAAARMWAESGDHRFSFSELGDSPQGAWTLWGEVGAPGGTVRRAAVRKRGSGSISLY